MAASSERSPPPFPDSEEPELLEDSDEGADAFTGTVSNGFKRVYKAKAVYLIQTDSKRRRPITFTSLTPSDLPVLLQP